MNKSALEVQISENKYRMGREIERSSKKFMRELTKKASPGLALDIGCGTGLNADHLSDIGHRVIGIDLSTTAIEKFNNEQHCGAAADISISLPFKNNSFDVVFASEVIEHCVDTEHFLSECYRVCKKDGYVFLSTPNSTFWAYRVFAIIGKTLSEVQHPGHIRFFSIQSLSEQIVRANFKIETSAGRHMYLIIPDRIGQLLMMLLPKEFLKKEKRFKTGRFFWHISNTTKNASSFWTDTMIFVLRK